MGFNVAESRVCGHHHALHIMMFAYIETYNVWLEMLGCMLCLLLWQ